MSKKLQITDDLEALLNTLPEEVVAAIRETEDTDNLLEVILDLGRVPTARFVDGEVILSETDVTRAQIDHVVQQLGDIDADNRAGLERTLHRISAIRNRRQEIVGLTCRVGRAVYGTSDIIEDIINAGKSILLLGRPGVGKTTMLREAARILADNKRVVIVDTSNEIGGDGDVPHPAVGRARRMQVATPSLQHEVMIEAVENHNPEVIVIDEIGRQQEAEAARTIGERGVQLVGTAHGNTLDNLMLNPTLSDLIGGIESVTLSDEEARRRGTQKTVLERRSPPTFDVLIEIQHRDRFSIHLDIAAAVDSLLRGFPLPAEIRTRDADGQIKVEKAAASPNPGVRRGGDSLGTRGALRLSAVPETSTRPRAESSKSIQTTRIYPYGVARNRLLQAVKNLRVPVIIVRTPSEADALVTLRTYYRKRQKTVMDAERQGMPVYVLRANTTEQIQRFLSDLFSLEDSQSNGMDDVTQQTQNAIAAVLSGERWVDLPASPPTVRRLQHEMARSAELVSHSYGKEPRRHVRIFRE
ncbi:MAG: AAA family ATPase [Anaerolineae bacterium]|jgi:stage III sporulation protein SpoIIIAA|nr:AAA family ATPase [Anaerolineae bacterium]MBT7070254.1 AAA family ATPase [Anaerolineae bacterium]MBT7325868.1 AAA family ATPase [Anaerolineae bacterium]